MSHLRAVVGHSQEIESARAAADVMDQVARQLGSRPPKAGVLFAGIEYEHATLTRALLERWPDLQLIGCTTDGEASSVSEVQENSLTFMAFDSDVVSFGAGVGRRLSGDPEAATAIAIEMAKQHLEGDARLCLTTPESLTVSGVAVLDGLRRALPKTTPVVGGTAGDQWRLKQTFQFCGAEVLSDSCPVLLMGGRVHVSVGVQSGWRPIGRKATVTSSTANVVRTIDGEPATEFYRRYLGDLSAGTLFVGDIPLAVHDPGGRFYLRAPASVDTDSGSVTFFADVAEGSTVQLTVGQKDDILKASEVSIRDAAAAFGDVAPEAALFFSCAARKQVLGTRASQEIGLLRAALAPDVPVCGFYAYGEIGPLQRDAASQFHNETFVTVLLGAA